MNDTDTPKKDEDVIDRKLAIGVGIVGMIATAFAGAMTTWAIMYKE
jgi:hypothetical protein